MCMSIQKLAVWVEQSPVAWHAMADRTAAQQCP